MPPDESVPLPAVTRDSEAELFCPDCGYDLHGIASDRCPECGFAIDRTTLAVSRIPWSHRREIGRIRAYWRTTWLAMFHRRQLAQEMNRPVSFSDARRFWLVTVLLAWVALAGWGLWFTSDTFKHASFDPAHRLGWILEAIIFASGFFALWLLLLTASGSASYWFAPSRLPVIRQNRAIALSYYTCAPLAWLWLPSLLAAFAVLLDSTNPRGMDLQVEWISSLLAGVLTFTLLVWCGGGAVMLMRLVTHCGAGRTLAMMVLLPLGWCLLLAVSEGIVFLTAWISLAIMSFR